MKLFFLQNFLSSKVKLTCWDHIHKHLQASIRRSWSVLGLEVYIAEKCPHHIQVVNKYIYKKNGKNRHHHKTLHSSIKYVATCKCRTRCQQTLHIRLHCSLHALYAQTRRVKTVLKSTYWLSTGGQDSVRIDSCQRSDSFFKRVERLLFFFPNHWASYSFFYAKIPAQQ